MTTPDSVLSVASERTGWPLVPLWSIARREDRIGQPDTELLSVYREFGVVRKADRDDNFNRASEDLSNYKVVRKGDLVLNKMKTWQGSLGVSDYDGIVSPAYFTCSVSPKVHGRYLHYLLRSSTYIALYAAASKGIRPNQWDLPYDEFRALPVLVPPIEAQRRIADFLDDQVARIDNIIAARRIQIDLVEEGLQGQIDRTTSCGDRRRLAPLLELLRDGTHTPPPRVDLGVPLLTAKNVKDQRLAFTATDTAISQSDADVLDRSFVPRSGDVLLSVKGSVGNVAVVPKAYPRFQVERNLAVLRPARQVLVSEWLYWCLRGRRVQDQIRLAMGFSAQPGVYLGDLASLIIAVPSIGAQASQAATLDAFRDSTVSAITAFDSSIDLLSELKRSLITAAVTGEFDVSSADGSRVRV